MGHHQSGTWPPWKGRPNDAEAAIGLAARHPNPNQVTIVRAQLLHRAGRDRDALAYLNDAHIRRPRRP